MLKKYEIAALKTSTSLALLNFAQNAIFSGGLVAVMCLAAAEIQEGIASPKKIFRFKKFGCGRFHVSIANCNGYHDQVLYVYP